MNILYISNYIDDEYFQKIFSMSKKKPSQNIQKFNKLFISGLEANSNVNNINVIATAPVNREISDKLFWKGKNVTKGKTSFNYIPFLNIKFLKQICIAFFSLFMILYWCLKNNNGEKENVLIVDGFFPIASSIGTIICKLVGAKVVTLYTDLPKVDVNDAIKKENFIRKIIKFVINVGDYINYNLSDGFILLTKYMNEVVNKHNKPYIVVEALVDSNFEQIENVKQKNVIMYAGGIYEKYGVKLLIDSFVEWNKDDYDLWLFGSDGDLFEYIKKLDNKNVKYLGTLPNDEIVKLEQECSLLVNPRLTSELYTKYSFPSKNMEYMVSGTPVLTTKLPGMPEEYNDYVFLIEDETKKGFINSFKKVFSKTKKELKDFGKKAQKFIMDKKNNIVQTTKVIDMISKDVKNDKRFGKITYFVITIICLVLLLLGLLFSNYHVSKLALFVYFLLISIISVINYKKYLPLLLFLLSFFTFTMGQYIFDNITNDTLYYLNFDNIIICRTMFIQFICLFITFTGYNYFNKLDILKKFKIKKIKVNKNATKFFLNIITFGLIITFTLSFLINVENAIYTTKYGYLALYDGTIKSIFPLVIKRIANYYYIFFCFFIALCKDLKYIKIAIFGFIINNIMTFIVGVRSDLVYSLMFVIYFYILYHLNNKISFSTNLKQYVLILVLCVPFVVIFLNSYNYIRNNVDVPNYSFSEQIQSFFVSQGRSVNIINYSQVYKDELKGNGSQYVFGEFNKNNNSKLNAITFGLVKKKDYEKTNLGVSISKLVLGDELVEKGNGLGSQFLAEIYLEGGVIVIIIYTFILGYLTNLLYVYSKKGFLYLYFLIAIFKPLLRISRSMAFEYLAPFFSTTTIILIISYLIITYIFNKKIERKNT